MTATQWESKMSGHRRLEMINEDGASAQLSEE